MDGQREHVPVARIGQVLRAYPRPRGRIVTLHGTRETAALRRHAVHVPSGATGARSPVVLVRFRCVVVGRRGWLGKRRKSLDRLCGFRGGWWFDGLCGLIRFGHGFLGGWWR